MVAFPAEVLNALKKLTDEVVAEESQKDILAKKVNESYQKFQKMVSTWGTISEKAYYNTIQPNASRKG